MQPQYAEIKLTVVNTQIALEEARRAYDTAVKARKLNEQTFAGERRKYELGTSTFLAVVLIQRDVVTAQSAEVNALNSYIRARSNVDLDYAFVGADKRPPNILPPTTLPTVKQQADFTPARVSQVR